MTRLKILVAAALLAVPVGLIGTTLVGPAHAHAHAEPVLQACQPSNLTGLPTAVRDCKLGYVRMYDEGPTDRAAQVLHGQLVVPFSNDNGSHCQAYVVQDRTAYAHPGGIWISAPDYLTGCEAAKRSLIEHAYQ